MALASPQRVLDQHRSLLWHVSSPTRSSGDGKAMRMRLSKALEVDRGEIISLVGAGGKTTTMYRLAQELSADGWRVITTTTTMIWSEERSEQTILEPQGRALLGKAQAALDRCHHVTVGSGLREDLGKISGIEPTLVRELAALSNVDAIIVEADGAKGRSVKAPAAHEPAIPAPTSILVPMAAVDAMGRRLDGDIAHRPQIVAGLANIELGQPITAKTISDVLLHPEGGMKKAPLEARIVPLINKVAIDHMGPPREVARLLLASPRVARVLLAAVAEKDPVKEAWGRVAAVILAAGESRRFGSPKQLLRWGEKTLIEHIVDTVLESSVEDTYVVLGHRAEEVGAPLRQRPVTLVINEDWRQGLSSSVRAGLQAMAIEYDACLFVLGDQPKVTSELIDIILERYRRTLAGIVAPTHRGLRGNPVLFRRSLFSELLRLEGDQGGREVVLRNQDALETVELEDEETFLDIDTVSDYQRAR